MKAALTATERGEFEAIISSASVDRDGDIVEPSAMVESLAKWANVGKLVPLAWAHGEDVIGHVDPASARVGGNAVIVQGWIDQGTPEAPKPGASSSPAPPRSPTAS